MLNGDPDLDADLVLDETIPSLDFKNNFIPVYFFVQKARRTSQSCNDSVQRLCTGDICKFRTSGYAKQASLSFEDHDFDWIIDNLPPHKVAAYVPHLPIVHISMDKLKMFILAHLDHAFANKYSTVFRKLICYYDYRAYGPAEENVPV